MSGLEELIQELCPNGVEYKKFGEIVESLRKDTLKVTELVSDGKYPVINSGRTFYGFYNDYNNEGNAITIASRGEYAGFINYSEVKFWAGGLCYPYRSYDERKISTKFLYYFLKHKESYIRNTLVAEGGIPALNKADIEKIAIPCPPLGVQSEIVRILDNFTLLTAELTAELTARKEQYEYYREHLFSFEKDKTDWIPIEKLFDIKGGYTPSKDKSEYWENGIIPWFRLDDINKNGRILFDANQHITKSAVKKNGPFLENSIIITTSATIGEYALIKVPFVCNQRFTCLTLKKEYINNYNMKFLLYYCFKLSTFCKEHLNKGNFASVDMAKFKQFKFPMITMNKQNEIVELLDKFEEYCSDSTQGLPAEIELRKQQYEYYRDKLLTFKELE